MNTYIPPTGTIQMMVGVHLNPKQEDTLYFESAGIRDEFFTSYIYATYDEQSYSRPTRDSVKIQDTADRLYKCQYMRFKNGNAFNGQWIYAFVLAVEYINNNTCQVFYAIDDMVTWFPQCTLRECFVEREIPETDNLYENLVPENLETGEYVLRRNGAYQMNEDMYYLFQTTVNSQGDPQIGVINGLPTPIHYAKLPVNASSKAFEALIKIFTKDYAQTDNVINVQIVPNIIGKSAVPEPSDTPSYKEVETDEVDFVKHRDLDGYFPKNKKLLTYPYCFLQVTNYSGQSVTYKWEQFLSYIQNPDEVVFDIMAIALGVPTVLCIPRHYRGLDSDYESALTLANFPPMPWACDTYKAYLAQNKASIMTSVLTGSVENISGIVSHQNQAKYYGAMSDISPTAYSGLSAELSAKSASMGAASLAVSTGLNIANTLAKISDIKRASPTTLSTLAQTDMFTLVADRCGFYGYNVTIKYQMAKIIDDYFSMFGYAQHKVKIPNTHSRPIWNYTKTQGCVVIGDVPASALQNISAIFDRGIRFWKEMAEIGNYEHDNSPR